MTSEELHAKKEWGTGGCSVEGCSNPAAYLVEQDWPGSEGVEEWWQYCCREHAHIFAQESGLVFPPVTN